MPGAHMFGLTDASALFRSGQNTQLSVEDLLAELRRFYTEMQRAGIAQQGAALVEFQQAEIAFQNAYNAIAGKYDVSALTQSQTNTLALAVDEQNQGGFSGVRGAVSPGAPISIHPG